MTMQHGTQPKKTPNKSTDNDDQERKRGVQPTLPLETGRPARKVWKKDIREWINIQKL